MQLTRPRALAGHAHHMCQFGAPISSVHLSAWLALHVILTKYCTSMRTRVLYAGQEAASQLWIIY